MLGPLLIRSNKLFTLDTSDTSLILLLFEGRGVFLLPMAAVVLLPKTPGSGSVLGRLWLFHVLLILLLLV